MNLENVTLNIRSQSARTHIQFYLRETSRTGKSTETKSQLVVARGWGGGAGEPLLMRTGLLSVVVKMF